MQFIKEADDSAKIKEEKDRKTESSEERGC